MSNWTDCPRGCRIFYDNVCYTACPLCESSPDDDDEQHIAEVIKSARTVQDYLWGDIADRDYSFELWLEILAKRIDKIRNIQKSNPHADVELRKRLLQTAAVAVAWMRAIGSEGK